MTRNNLRLLEHPLNVPVKQRGVLQRSNLLVEPEMNSRDGNRPQMIHPLLQFITLHARRKNASQRVEWNCADRVIKFVFAVIRTHRYAVVITSKRLYCAAH